MAVLAAFSKRVAVVVSSCDAFVDAWKPFASFLERFWADCPLELFLITNQLTVESPKIRALAVGKDEGWSSNLMKALAQIPQPYVLYCQEDYFLTAPVRAEQLAADFEYCFDSGADSLCFRARTEVDAGTELINDRFGLVPLASDGRTRCQVTLWKKASLQSILRPGEMAWDFEARGSARTQNMTVLSYLSRENPPIQYLMSAISRGLWMPEAISHCQKHNVRIDPFFRPIYADGSWRRRYRRALARMRLKQVLRRQSGRPIEL